MQTLKKKVKKNQDPMDVGEVWIVILVGIDIHHKIGYDANKSRE